MLLWLWCANACFCLLYEHACVTECLSVGRCACERACVRVCRSRELSLVLGTINTISQDYTGYHFNNNNKEQKKKDSFFFSFFAFIYKISAQMRTHSNTHYTTHFAANTPLAGSALADTLQRKSDCATAISKHIQLNDNHNKTNA